MLWIEAAGGIRQEQGKPRAKTPCLHLKAKVFGAIPPRPVLRKLDQFTLERRSDPWPTKSSFESSNTTIGPIAG